MIKLVFLWISLHSILWGTSADDASTLIVNGTESINGRYPYQVSLVTKCGNQFCSATLVDTDWVLCAAHCGGCGKSVHIGRHDLSEGDESYEVIEIEREIIHPDFNLSNLDNDFMLMKLASSSSYSPVLLDDGSTDLVEGTNVTAIGWGTTSAGGLLSDVLLEVEMDTLENSNCSNAYGDLITDNMICASREGKDTCQGDSGGPLIFKGSDASTDIQIGVTSWGYGCAHPSYPGVYARISAKIDWIDEVISAEKTSTPEGNLNDRFSKWDISVLHPWCMLESFFIGRRKVNGMPNFEPRLTLN